MSKFVLILVFTFSSLLPAFAAEKTDFDGDGVSDLTYISIKEGASILGRSSNALVWGYRSSKNLRSKTVATLGIAGQHVAMAHWTGNAKSEIAVVAKDPNSNSMVWVVQKASGEIGSFILGTVNDLAVSGGDYDGNGLSDAVAVEVRNNVLYWKLLYNPFGTAASTEIAFGEKGDTPFYWITASGQSLLALLRKNPDGTSSVFLLNSMTREQYGVVLARNVSSSQTPVTILNGAQTYLVLTTKSGSSTQVYLFRPTGTLFRKLNVKGTGDMVIGNFFKSSAGEEVAVKNGRSYSIVNPFKLKTQNVNLSAQVPIDEFNINALGAWGGSGGGNGGGGGSGGACTAQNPRDGSKKGFVWKPNSDTQHYAVAVIPANYTGRIAKMEAFTSAGAFIKEIGLKNCGNNDSVGPRCNYQDRSLTGANYKSKYGSIILKMTLKDSACVTFALDDPSKRID